MIFHVRLIATAILVLGLPLWGQLEFPSRPTALVNDYAHLLSPQERAYMEKKLAAWEEATSNQLVIATFESLAGEDLNDISIRIAEAWQPGQTDRDNGVLITVFLRDRKLRIEVGYGLEGALPDALVNDIRMNLINPHFRQGDYFNGLNVAVDAVVAAVGGEYEALRKSRAAPRQRGRGGGAGLIFIMIFLFLLLSRGGRGRGGLLPALLFLSLGSSMGGRGGYVGGGFRGGGFGGLGGGGFGGGGAGGSW